MNYTSLLFSLIAFAFSVLAFFGIKGQPIDNGALALISICTTLMVGISVVDVMRLRDLEKQMEELKDTQKSLVQLNNEIGELKNHANISLDANWGFTLYTINPQKAIAQIWKAVVLAFSLNDTTRIKTCISLLEAAINRICNDKSLSDKLRKECMGKMPINITKEIRESEDFLDFQDQLVKVNDMIESILKSNK